MLMYSVVSRFRECATLSPGNVVRRLFSHYLGILEIWFQNVLGGKTLFTGNSMSGHVLLGERTVAARNRKQIERVRMVKGCMTVILKI